MENILADGTYEYRVNGVDIKATVQNSVVTAWERNTLPAPASELARINFTLLVMGEVKERARLGNLLHPVKFTPVQEVA